MTTFPLLAHKMDRNPFGRCVSASVAHTGLAPQGTTQESETNPKRRRLHLPVPSLLQPSLLFTAEVAGSENH